MPDLIPVVFNEGEPLDPNKLNDLRSNITNTYQVSAGLQNAFANQSKTILLDVGVTESKTFTSRASGSAFQILQYDLPINSKFGNNVPTYVVSLKGTIAKEDSVGVSYIDNGGKPIAYVTRTAGTQALNLAVTYVAFLLQ